MWLRWSGDRWLAPLVRPAAPTRWQSERVTLRTIIAGDRCRPRQICPDSNAPPMQSPRYRLPFGLSARTGSSARAAQVILVLCAGYLLAGSACFAAGDASGSSAAMPAADHTTETLLHRIVQQIAGG